MNDREFTRVRILIPVDFEASDQDVSGEIRNISLDGLWLPTAVAVPKGTLGRVTIHLSEETTIRAHGVVVRSEPSGIAIHFLELLDLESYEHLRNLILYNAVDPAQAEEEFDSHVGLRRAEPAPPLP